MLAAACQMFLGKTEAEIAHIALETLEGHQRAIMAHMTVEVGLRAGRDREGMPECKGPKNPTSLRKTVARGSEHVPSLFFPSCYPRKSIRTGRNSQSRFSKWPPQTWSTWASAWSAIP